MCESFNLQYGTNYLTVMPANLYGPNDNFDLERSHVLPAMIRKIHLSHSLYNEDWDSIYTDLNVRPIGNVSGSNTKEEILVIFEKYGITSSCITFWGTGSPMREFLWSEDLADACIYLMQNVNFEDTYSLHQNEIRNTHRNRERDKLSL